MIKISNTKYGSIKLTEQSLIKRVKECLLETIPEKKINNITVDIKKNSLKKIEIFLKKTCDISIDDEKNLYEQVTFLLSMRYKISNSLIIFNYEN